MRVAAEDVDAVFHLFTFNMAMMDAFMGTGAICVITAANTPGTIVNEIVCGYGKYPDNRVSFMRIGHPSGVMNVGADLCDSADKMSVVKSGNIERTARRIMEGFVYVKN